MEGESQLSSVVYSVSDEPEVIDTEGPFNPNAEMGTTIPTTKHSEQVTNRIWAWQEEPGFIPELKLTNSLRKVDLKPRQLQSDGNLPIFT